MTTKQKTPIENKISDFKTLIKEKIIYLNTIFITLIISFLLFLVWQLFIEDLSNSLEFFPEGKTAFATELNLGDETFDNTHFRNWLLNNTFGENILKNLSQNELFFLLNKKYRLGIANIDGGWIIALKPAKTHEKALTSFLDNHKLDIKPYQIHSLEISKREFFVTILNGYLLIANDKNTLYQIYETKNKKLPNVSYTERLFLLPKKNFFKLNNLIFINPNKTLKQVTTDLKLNSDIELDNIISTESDLSENLFGTFEITNKNVGLNLISFPSKNLISKDQVTGKESTNNRLGCRETNLLSISGTDFKSKWINLQKKLQQENYLSLQKLVYLFISDLKEKTEFDLEEDLIFKANRDYCFLIDIKPNSNLIYSLALEKEQNLNSEKFIKNIELAFIRFAPFSKPKLRNYILEDGTKASEWIIETDTLTKKETIDYQGIKIFETKFLEEYSTSFNYAYFNDLILISSDLSDLKKMIQYYSSNSKQSPPEESLEIIPENLSPILNSIISSNKTENKKFFNELILPIKKIEVNKTEDYLYNVSFYY